MDRSSDCVACTDGYRLFHVYEDCTGFCVDDETYEAIKDTGLGFEWNPFDGDSECEPWPLECGDEDEGGGDDEASPKAFCTENGFDDWEDDWKDDRTVLDPRGKKIQMPSREGVGGDAWLSRRPIETRRATRYAARLL